MCMRYQLHGNIRDLATRFGVEQPTIPFEFPEDARPTNRLPIIRINSVDERELTLMRWGLVPRWAHDIKEGNRFFNARSETVHTLAVFRGAAQQRRCLIPVTAFCEWKTFLGSKRKEPIWFSVPEMPIYSIAGIWETWKSRDTDETIQSYSLLTTQPNELVVTIHDRMPVIVQPEMEELWLTEPFSEELLQAVRCPYPADKMLATFEPHTQPVLF
jgi:putative SOS response-associated peptidase YedK